MFKADGPHVVTVKSVAIVIKMPPSPERVTASISLRSRVFSFRNRSYRYPASPYIFVTTMQMGKPSRAKKKLISKGVILLSALNLDVNTE